MSFQHIIEQLRKSRVGCGVATSSSHDQWTIWAWKRGRPTISGQVRSMSEAWLWLHQEVVQNPTPPGEPTQLDRVLERLRSAHIPHGLAVLPTGDVLVWLGDQGKRPSHVVRTPREAATWLDRSARRHFGTSKYTAA
jgi:hypothetical protein